MVPQRQDQGLTDRSGQVTSLQASYSEYFAGPIPPPSLLARYNDIVPNGAERILAMAERQSQHRETIESQVVTGNIDSQKRGTIFGFILALVTILGGFALVYAGKDTSGMAAIIGSLVSLVSVFVYARHKQAKERVDKAKTLAERRKK
jgi:uncharacterized membrane protein